MTERDGEVFDPAGWLEAGFTVDEARVWRRWRIGPAAAVAWRAAGVADGLTAAQWSVAGVRPETVPQWQAIGVPPVEAVQWHELGFALPAVTEHKKHGRTPIQAFDTQRTTAQTAQASLHPMSSAFVRFREAGVRPDLMHSYAIARWMDDEALAWARCDIDPTAARIWMVLRLRPAEAARLARRGAAPEQVIAEWWGAGIPYGEVGAWLGAGLTAQEAVAQRAAGVTVEQAEALRALREGDDADDTPG